MATGMSFQEWSDLGSAKYKAESLASAAEAQQRELTARRNGGELSSGAWASKEQLKAQNRGFSGGGAQSPTLLNPNYQQAQFDPWSRYRNKAGDLLNGQLDAGDPSDFYKNKLETMLGGGDGSGFATSDPSYQFRFEQGRKATERSLASKGLLGSGNAAAAISDYGQNMASTEYEAQFGRLLQGMQGVSQQYDTQQRRLMEMAGVNLDPTAAAKLNLQAEGINTDRMGLSNQYNLGMTNAANDRYGIDVGASTSRLASRMGGGDKRIDTESLYAGNAKRDVYSANWWADEDRLG